MKFIPENFAEIYLSNLFNFFIFIFSHELPTGGFFIAAIRMMRGATVG